MGQLRALQEELNRILMVGSTTTTSPFWKEGLPERLQVYKNTVHGNCYDTLDSDFPLTKKQFTDQVWFNLCQDFFKKAPPSFWELNQCVTTFPPFLRKRKEALLVRELAEFELIDLLVFISTASVKKGWGRTNPTATIRVFQHEIMEWVLKDASPNHPPAQKPEVIVFYRDADHGGHFRKADPLLLLLMDHFSKPNAQLADVESTRKDLLPKNNVPLQDILNDLVENDLILL